MTGSTPLLWHLPASHYSEKVRWALDHKRVPHRRRASPPGAHMIAAYALSGGESVTFPILVVDGQAIHNSSTIIAALEESHPEPALYPADPALRLRAVELEAHLDAVLGPATRTFTFHELGRDMTAFRAVVEKAAPPPLDRVAGAATNYARAYTRKRYGIGDPADLANARVEILSTLDLIEDALDGTDYLVGDSFTVADLTAAALLYPVALPDEGPLGNSFPIPAGTQELREAIADRPAYQWVDETYRRHRSRARRTRPARVG